MLVAARHHRAQTEEDLVTGHRHPDRRQVGQGGVLQVHGAVGQVEDGDALRRGGPGEVDRAGHRLRLLFGHPQIPARRSEEHTSELQSLMRTSYAVFCLKKKKNSKDKVPTHQLLDSTYKTK